MKRNRESLSSTTTMPSSKRSRKIANRLFMLLSLNYARFHKCSMEEALKVYTCISCHFPVCGRHVEKLQDSWEKEIICKDCVEGKDPASTRIAALSYVQEFICPHASYAYSYPIPLQFRAPFVEYMDTLSHLLDSGVAETVVTLVVLYMCFRSGE